MSELPPELMDEIFEYRGGRVMTDKTHLIRQTEYENTRTFEEVMKDLRFRTRLLRPGKLLLIPHDLMYHVRRYRGFFNIKNVNQDTKNTIFNAFVTTLHNITSNIGYFYDGQFEEPNITYEGMIYNFIVICIFLDRNEFFNHHVPRMNFGRDNHVLEEQIATADYLYMNALTKSGDSVPVPIRKEKIRTVTHVNNVRQETDTMEQRKTLYSVDQHGMESDYDIAYPVLDSVQISTPAEYVQLLLDMTDWLKNTGDNPNPNMINTMRAYREYIIFVCRDPNYAGTMTSTVFCECKRVCISLIDDPVHRYWLDISRKLVLLSMIDCTRNVYKFRQLLRPDRRANALLFMVEARRYDDSVNRISRNIQRDREQRESEAEIVQTLRNFPNFLD
jgi:hypothetical protein